MLSRRTRLIIAREFAERTRQRAYRITLAIGVVVMIAAIVVPVLVSSHGNGGSSTIAVVAPASAVGSEAVPALSDALRSSGAGAVQITPAASQTAATALVRSGDADFGLVLGGTLAQPTALVLEPKNPDDTVEAQLGAALNRLVIERRVAQLRGSDPGAVTAPVTARAITVTKPGPSSAAVTMSFVLSLALYLSVLLLVQGFASGLVTDRSTRVTERLLTAARPVEHLVGKLLGVGAAGGLQYGLWFLAGAIAAIVADNGGLGSSVTKAPIGILLFFPVAFVLIYLMYASIATILVLPARRVEDTGGALFPATALMIAAYVLASTMVSSGGDVSSTEQWLSMIPFFSPIMMLVRIGVDPPPAWQLAVGVIGPLLVTAASIYFVVPAYARNAIDVPKAKGLVATFRLLRSRDARG